MKTVWTLGLSVALAMAGSTTLMAFQEQQGAAPAAGAPAQPAPAPQAADPTLGLEQGDAAKAAEGTEVRIPGVGKIGVLPKMDFGLELLYGAAETEKQPDVPSGDASPDDLTIRGSLKHKF